MSQKKFAYTRISSYSSSLSSRTVIIEFSPVLILRSISTLMIKHRNPLYLFCQPRNKPGITAISITAGSSGRHYQSGIRYYIPLLRCPVSSILDVINLAYRNLVIIYHITTDMRQCRFLSEDVPTTRHTMLQRNGFYGYRMIFIYYLRLLGIYRNKFYFIFHSLHEEINLTLK